MDCCLSKNVEKRSSIHFGKQKLFAKYSLKNLGVIETEKISLKKKFLKPSHTASTCEALKTWKK